MDLLLSSSQAGDIDSLYAGIRQNPNVLAQVDEIPFIHTPLHVAASAGHVEYAMEVIRLKPSFARKVNQDGFTPLHLALQREHTKMVLRLVDTDGELVRVKGRDGITPLHYVVQARDLHLVARFLSICPESIEDVTVRNETALHVSLKNNATEVFEFLVDRLHWVFPGQNLHCVKCILNMKDIEGNTVLHIATSRNQLKALQLLLKCNSSNPGLVQLNAKNDDGLTALDLSILSNYLDCERLLRQVGAERAGNLNGITPTPEPTHQYSNQANPLSASKDLAYQTSSGQANLSREQLGHWESYFKFYFLRSNPDQVRTSLLTVSVIMATTTFRAGLSPPGGLGKDNTAILAAYPFSYIWFMFFNTAGFLVSLNTIRVLIRDHPMFWELYVVIFAMVAAYYVTVAIISPRGYIRWLLISLSILMPMFIMIASESIIKWYKRHTRKALARRSNENA